MKSRNPALILSLLSMFLLLSPGVSAQSLSQAAPFTITVTGEGTAAVPAEEALVIITLGTDGNAFYDPATGIPIEATATPELNATPVIDAMVAYGVPVNDIAIEETPFSGEWGSGTMPMPIMIVATIPQPTVENLTGLLAVVREAAASESLYINQFGVMYSIADCRPLRQQARANAVVNARMEADDQAAALDTTIGDVVSSRDSMSTSSGSYLTNSCSTFMPMKPYTPLYMASPFDPRLPAEVSITLAVEVSFEIP